MYLFSEAICRLAKCRYNIFSGRPFLDLAGKLRLGPRFPHQWWIRCGEAHSLQYWMDCSFFPAGFFARGSKSKPGFIWNFMHGLGLKQLDALRGKFKFFSVGSSSVGLSEPDSGELFFSPKR